MDYMIEVLMLLAVFATNKVLMLLAFFATNILKPISKALEDYDGLMSMAELIVEGIFLLLVLKESAMTIKNFKWMEAEQKEKREEKTKRELSHFAMTVINAYVARLNEVIRKKNKDGIKQMTSDEYFDDYCQEVSDTCFLPISFCKDIMETALLNAYRESSTPKENEFDIQSLYNALARTNNEYLGGYVTPRFINKYKKYFNSDDEIDEIYEKLTNIKL